MEQNQGNQGTFHPYPILSVPLAGITVPFTLPFLNLTSLGPMVLPSGSQPCESIQIQQFTDRSLEYFKSFFSPKETAKSLQRRNQNLQMLSFENSDGEEPDDVYNRRKKKVCDLMTQEEEQVQTILNIRKQSESKYDAIIQFVKFFCLLKDSIAHIRTDYYSSKTFCALKNASEQEIANVTKVMKKMYQNVNVNPQPNKVSTSFQYVGPQSNEAMHRIMEFLIIPRFLISKEKIVRLIRDEELQKNFQFLVMHQCLGHYNNEANKKMPEEHHMKYVRELLVKKSGREKFKKICSINHGNKFLKSHGQLYYGLYSQSLNYLQHLDSSLKKGKKFESIKKDLEKMAKQSEDTVGNSSYTENQSSNNIYEFKSLGEILNKIESQNRDNSITEQKMEQPEGIDISQHQPIMQKRMLKMMSTPTQEGQAEMAVTEGRRFQVRKFKTMQQKQEENIILIPPPHYSQI